MSALPLWTSTVTVTRRAADPTDDPYEPATTPTVTTVATGVRAHLSSPSGRENLTGGEQEIVEQIAYVQPVGLAAGDLLTDSEQGLFRVVWARLRSGLGMRYEQAGLSRVTGVAG